MGLNYIEKAADNGMDEAQLFLGNYYLNSHEKNSRGKARKWLLAASEYNNPRAQYLLGKIMLENGKDQDNAKAAEWLQRAADAGIVDAGMLLSRLRADGKGLQSASPFPSTSVASKTTPQPEAKPKKIAKVKVDPTLSMRALNQGANNKFVKDANALTPKKQFNLAMDVP